MSSVGRNVLDLLKGIKRIGVASSVEAGQYTLRMKLKEPEFTGGSRLGTVDDSGPEANGLAGSYGPCESPTLSEGFLEGTFQSPRSRRRLARSR